MYSSSEQFASDSRCHGKYTIQQESSQFYRDGLGLAVVEQWQTAEGRGVILALGPHPTFELLDATQATLADRLEVGRRVSGPVRFVFQVPEVEAEVSAL